MKSWWKLLLSLAVVLPLAAYLTGSLVASAAVNQSPREVLRIDPPDRTPPATGAPTGTPGAKSSGDDEVIIPEYDDLDGRDDPGDDDHRGSYGGDDNRRSGGDPGGDGSGNSGRDSGRGGGADG